MRLFEFGDLKITPAIYRKYLREYLFFFYKIFGYYRLWLPYVSAFIIRTNKKVLMEHCSGDGRVLLLIESQLFGREFDEISYIQSDIRPDFFAKKINQLNSKFHYIEKKVDATRCNDYNKHPKIFINSFHHFTREQALKILEKNLKNRNEVIILEYCRNSILGYLSMFISLPVIFVTLPFRTDTKDLPMMFLFTYALPLFPLMVLWDGIISCLRSYSNMELAKIIYETGIEAKLTTYIKSSIGYPAGVTVHTINFEKIQN